MKKIITMKWHNSMQNKGGVCSGYRMCIYISKLEFMYIFSREIPSFIQWTKSDKYTACYFHTVKISKVWMFLIINRKRQIRPEYFNIKRIMLYHVKTISDSAWKKMQILTFNFLNTRQIFFEKLSHNCLNFKFSLIN